MLRALLLFADKMMPYPNPDKRDIASAKIFFPKNAEHIL
jgi:hypothetical protein